eukprot:tig00021464_g21725.t1
MRRFPTNRHMPFLLGTEVLEQRVDPERGVEILVQYVRIDIQAPMWIKRMLHTYSFVFHMTIERDNARRVMRTVSKNATFPGAMVVHEETVFTQDAANPAHTHLSQRGSLEVLKLPGVGHVIEKYSMKSYTKNSVRARQIDELFIAEVYEERRKRGLPAPEGARASPQAALALSRDTSHYSFADLGPDASASAGLREIPHPHHAHHEEIEPPHSARGRHEPAAPMVPGAHPGGRMPRARSVSDLPAAEAARGGAETLLPSSSGSELSDGAAPGRPGRESPTHKRRPSTPQRSPWMAGRPGPAPSLIDPMGRESLELPPPLHISLHPPSRDSPVRALPRIQTPTGRSRAEGPVPENVFVSRPYVFRTGKYHLEKTCPAARRARSKPADVIAAKSLSPCPQCAGHLAAELDDAVVYSTH